MLVSRFPPESPHHIGTLIRGINVCTAHRQAAQKFDFPLGQHRLGRLSAAIVSHESCGGVGAIEG
jgi:hypothetical protein